MRLLLVDDHPLFGVGFVHALTHARPGIDARAALTLDEGLHLAGRFDPDLVLIDYRLGDAGGLDGLEGVRRFGARYPLLARVLVSGVEDPGLSQRARAAGAAGFLAKSLPIAAILAAIDRIVAGGECFDHAAPMPQPAVERATARQLEVLALIGQGRLNKQIADELGIAERTVKLHVTALLDAFGARNRTHLLVRARELGLLA